MRWQGKKAALLRRHTPGATALVLGLCLPPPASAACEALNPPTPSVAVDVTGPQEPRIVAASEAEIRRRATETNSDAPADAVTRGLTTSETSMHAGFTLATENLADGSRCVALRRVEGTVTGRDATVLIDRRYRRGSCQYDTILTHERQHVQINADALKQTGRLLEERLNVVARRWAGQWLTESDTHQVEREVKEAIAEAERLAREEADRRHHRIDTPAAYAQVQAGCDSW